MFDLHLWWPDWAAFLAMGRHGPYVWGSVAAVVLALAGEQFALRLRAQRLARARAAEEEAS